MVVFKCKMCGGALEVQKGTTVVSCEYCGTKQTLPRLDDERKANLYDRAGHFRRNNEFDKAMGIYEQILNEDSTDAESYWSLILCRYGIEYVEDPATRKRLPTINRTQYTSVFDDEDYKSALQYADNEQRKLYEAEAAVINDIQKNILAISQKETPFDVFICYKETDANGRRTPDSVLATELYHELTREGYKVFFSRITLEDKLGQEYEPYIFAALNSAKVMVVLGTKPEHFNAVWVKNEWSRYLALIKNGARKTLIPAYRDMDPYDLPEEFSHLQALDMAKLGFVQDLIRGIGKLAVGGTTVAEPRRETAAQPVDEDVRTVLQRGFLSLENSEWSRADSFFERVLNSDLENAEAYLGKLMAWAKVKNRDELPRCRRRLEKNGNYRLAMRFGDGEMAAFLEDISAQQEEQRCKRRQKRANWLNLLILAIIWSVSFACIDDCEPLCIGLSFLPYLFLAIECFLAKKQKMRCLQSTKKRYLVLLWLCLAMNTLAFYVTSTSSAYGVDSVSVNGFHIFIFFLIFTELYPLVCFLIHKRKVLKTVLCTTAAVLLLGLNIFFFYISPCTYRIENSTATVVGTMNPAALHVTIQDSVWGLPVRTIGSDVFYYNENLKSVTIPDSVTSIGDRTFYGCSSLTSVTIPDSVTSIGFRTFSGCSSLTSVTIPDSVTSIGEGAFYDCSSLTSVMIPDSVTSIGDRTFYGCSSLTSVTIPDSVNYIGWGAFSDCYSLTKAVFKEAADWKVVFFINDESSKIISKNNIKNPATAAEYLANTYDYYEWSRE